MLIREKEDCWRSNPSYICYIESGESAAVYIVRDVVQSIDTKGKWIDVLSLSTNRKRRVMGRRNFNWIIVELFPRNLQPLYDECDTDYNKYLTWETAHKDIRNQRRVGYHGEKYLVLCDLYNKNHNMNIMDTVEEKWEYRIQAVKRINSKQVKYIERNFCDLENKINQSRKSALEILRC